MSWKAQLTPAEMLKRGVFGASYFEMATKADFKGLSVRVARLAERNQGKYDVSKNYYSVRAGLHYTEWMANGWIFPEDPLGWFHWYCRYHNGRRHERDAHQIRRYENYGDRWGRRAARQLMSTGRPSPVIMQGLLQWAYDPLPHISDIV